ncbi:alpha/beta fold hydrolase [Humibacter ginsenosidimutans]|uniref:Alpha/beta hydrolase n=1 Tax=Humibacter ginsenosidimutans TaxID=2599293 RepID=A0A5B8M399_9MICO|nr:alpha/beta hydrolase [Humibacter ginsenosidimutans]QDZ15077.1 alpha/beta hydrolase [Humibacter ginsenosidimutans]
MSETTTTAVHSADGTAIAYELHGDGPGVILIDGAMCFRGAGPMRGLSAQLDDDFTVLTYDRRGRGQSSDTAPFGVDRELDDLDALLEPLLDSTGTGCAAPALLGISSGAALALRAAAHLGDRIRSVVVYEPPFMPEPFVAGASDYTAALGAALAAGDRDRAVALFLGRVGMPEQAIAGMQQSPAWQGMTAIAPTLAYDDAQLGDSRVPTEIVARIAAPVLALAGGASPEMLQYGAREVAASARNGAFDVLPEQGHDVDAAVLAAGIREFLRP